MNIFIPIYFLLLVYALVNYHQAILIYGFARIFLSQFVPFYAVSNMPMVPLEFVVTLCFVLMLVFYGICKNRLFDSRQEKEFPLKIAFMFCIISIVVPSLNSSVDSLFGSATVAFKEITLTYIFVYLFWRELKTENDIKLFVNGFSIILAVAIFYGLFELANSFENPLIDYELSLNPNAEEGTWNYSEEDRGGRGRVRSIFAHAIGCGGYMALGFSFFLYLNENHPKIWNMHLGLKVALFTGMFFTMLAANSRGPLVYFGIAILFLLKLKTAFRLLAFAPIILLLFYDSFAPYFQMVASLFSSSAQQDMGGGSNMEMRTAQFLATFLLWQNHIWLGDGARATQHWIEQNIGLLGAESVWIWLLINRGVVGIVTHLFLCYQLTKLGVGKAKKYVVGSVIGWLAFTTATSTPGLDMSFLIMLLLVVYRIEILQMRKPVSSEVNNG